MTSRTEVAAASAAMREAVRIIDRAARSNAPVVLVGPSGVGKERLAQRLHAHSPRGMGPFITVACAAVPESLAESLFFGHVRGAFSGATQDSPGHFTRAHGGTLFLDELGSLSLALQAKLLRAIDGGEVQPLGGEATRVDVRLVVASSTRLEELVTAGTLREDLCYRLSSVTVRVPPLRERPEDVEALMAELVQSRKLRLTTGAREALRTYPWPGNVRELVHTLEAASVMVDEGSAIDLRHLPERIQRATLPSSGDDPVEKVVGPDTPDSALDVRRRVAALERALMAEALRRHGGNRRAAARACGLSPRAFLYKLRAYGLE
ncbi:MAG: sigma 54-interacting transcriptional regulator [Myxococcota bacterium]